MEQANDFGVGFEEGTILKDGDYPSARDGAKFRAKVNCRPNFRTKNINNIYSHKKTLYPQSFVKSQEQLYQMRSM